MYMRELLHEIFIKRIPARGCISPLRFWISEGIFPEQELSTLVKEKCKQFMNIPPFRRRYYVLMKEVLVAQAIDREVIRNSRERLSFC